MSHCYSLYTSDSDTPKSENNISEYVNICNYNIPFVWLTMFDKGDIKARDADYDSENEEDNEYYLEYVTSIGNAIKNLTKRRDSILKLIPEKYQDHFFSFVSALNASTRKYIHLSLEDVVSIIDDSMVAVSADWDSLVSELDEEIKLVRVGASRYILGSGVPRSWQRLFSYTQLKTGMLFFNLNVFNVENQYCISGAENLEEYREWGI